MSQEQPQGQPEPGEGGLSARGTVLVPLDGSPTAAAALPLARAAALILDAPLHVLHACDEPLSTEELMTRLFLSPEDLAGLVLEQAVGDASAAIQAEVESHQTRLIVMTTHGWTTDVQRPLGRVAAEVLLSAGCSVLLVRAEIAHIYAREHRTLRRILIPLDGTPTTAAALAPAAELAARSGAELDILHVANTVEDSSLEAGTMTVPQYEDAPYHEWRAWQREFAQRYLGFFQTQEPDVHVTSGDPAEEIVREATAHGDDLIVLVWKGKDAAARSRTVSALLRRAPCPLLFLRARTLELPPTRLTVSI